MIQCKYSKGATEDKHTLTLFEKQEDIFAWLMPSWKRVMVVQIKKKEEGPVFECMFILAMPSWKNNQ